MSEDDPRECGAALICSGHPAIQGLEEGGGDGEYLMPAKIGSISLLAETIPLIQPAFN
jgi:hypothetical protein